MLVHFVLPVKDEDKIIKNSLNQIVNFLEKQNYSFDWKIIVVVNGSSDNFCSLAKSLESNRVKVDIIKQAGKGLAIKTAFRKSEADILVFFDIDLSVPLDYLDVLLNPLLIGKADLVIGSRLLPESNTHRFFIRDWSSRFYNKLSRIIFKHKIRDLQCGFKAIKKETFLYVDKFLQDDAWFFDTELVLLSSLFSYRIKEIPVDWEEKRYHGRKSKIKPLYDAYQFINKLIKFKKRFEDIKKTS